MPYKLAREFLLQVNNAKQLHQLEINSPQIVGEDAECWTRLIGKKFKVLQERYQYKPKNPASWHKIYEKYEQLEAAQKAEAEANLKAAFAGIKKEKTEKVSTVIDFDRRKLPQPPRDGRGPSGIRRPGTGRRGEGPDQGNLRFTGGTRTKVTSGQSILRKAKREAREIAARNRLATPTGLLPVARNQISAAPQAMIDAARIKAQPATRIHAPTARAPSGADSKRSRELEEREARLRKLKNTSAAHQKSATMISDSDLEDDADDNGYGADDHDELDSVSNASGDSSGPGGLDVDDLEDLFDAKPKPSSSRQTVMAKANPAPKRPGLLTNAPGSTRKPIPLPATPRSKVVQPKKENPVPAEQKHQHSPPKPHYSPPATAAAPSASSPELKPQMPAQQRKRKPVDIFMKPKPKVQKR